jgi:hypothetical protein
MKLFWTPLAKLDLIEISRFIAEGNPIEIIRVFEGHRLIP